jgi:hypothetical protein
LTGHFSHANLALVMKYIPALSFSAALAVVACDTMNRPLTSSGSFDPLAPAGGGGSSVNTVSGPSFKPGQFVRAAIDTTAFFSKRPKGDADADKILPRDTQMKIVSTDASYVKVELDSGEVGFVPSVMVYDPTAPAAGLPGDNYSVYPPGGDPGAPLPVFDASGLPPAGSVPPVIDPNTPPFDPNAPGVTPPGTPPAAGAPATVTPPAELPPGIDDVTPSKPEESKPAGQ